MHLSVLAVVVNSLFDPHSLWSLWVPGVLLLIIVIAAVYFARLSIR